MPEEGQGGGMLTEIWKNMGCTWVVELAMAWGNHLVGCLSQAEGGRNPETNNKKQTNNKQIMDMGSMEMLRRK